MKMYRDNVVAMRAINTHQAKGRLIAALDMLARHYGFN